MRRASPTPDRISLRLPASTASVALAERAARGLLHHRNGAAAASARLASASAELVNTGLSSSRPQDRLLIHYDVAPAEVTVTVEVRRRGRWQSGTPFRQSIAIGSGANGQSGPDGQPGGGGTPPGR